MQGNPEEHSTTLGREQPLSIALALSSLERLGDEIGAAGSASARCLMKCAGMRQNASAYPVTEVAVVSGCETRRERILCV
jgi:hypothetical protein